MPSEQPKQSDYKKRLIKSSGGHDVTIEVKMSDLIALLETSRLPESVLDTAVSIYEKRIVSSVSSGEDD